MLNNSRKVTAGDKGRRAPPQAGHSSLRCSTRICKHILVLRSSSAEPTVLVSLFPTRKNDRQKTVVFSWSGIKDSNLRPRGPKPRALANCANPRKPHETNLRFSHRAAKMEYILSGALFLDRCMEQR
jgi:hypothetical protein